MAYTYHELKEKTVQELRDIAKDVQHDALKGALQMKGPSAAGSMHRARHRHVRASSRRWHRQAGDQGENA